jgi:hypothetical protein
MVKKIREQRRVELIELMAKHELERQHISMLLHVSPDTVAAWLKPETSKSSNPVPQWALELLGYKLTVPKATRRKKRLAPAVI